VSAVVVGAGVLLGAAFVLAGASKLAAGQAWLGQAAGLGVPRWLATPVPYTEIVVGAFVAVRVARPWPVVVALALLAAFTALIVRLLATGRRPACACFGAWSASPIGWRHLARNAALAALAVVALL